MRVQEKNQKKDAAQTPRGLKFGFVEGLDDVLRGSVAIRVAAVFLSDGDGASPGEKPGGAGPGKAKSGVLACLVWEEQSRDTFRESGWKG